MTRLTGEFLPVALSIAGSDSGGGAGIQADLAAFRFFGVFGTTAITAVTAQTPAGVIAVETVSAEVVETQVRVVLEAFHVGAVKTGMLGDAERIRAVRRALEKHRGIPLVVDPIVVAGSGRRLLTEAGVQALSTQLFPLAHALTPNVPEAALLLGCALETASDLAEGVRKLAVRYHAFVFLKGGHSGDPACDWFSDGRRVWRMRAPCIRFPERAGHGTGCSLSAAWAAGLACGERPLVAAVKAKAYVLGTLRSIRRLGGQAAGRWEPNTLPVWDVSIVEWK